MQTTQEIPELRPSLNDLKVRSLINAIAKAPNHYIQIEALETCLRQVWALIPEEDEHLFWDNIQRVVEKARKWKDKA
jgi:hypothetical protein